MAAEPKRPTLTSSLPGAVALDAEGPRLDGHIAADRIVILGTGSPGAKIGADGLAYCEVDADLFAAWTARNKGNSILDAIKVRE